MNDQAAATEFFNLADPAFSTRDPAVHAARARDWYARTSYGLAVLRYEDVGALLKDRRLRQGSYAWPAHNRASGAFADWWLRMLFNQEGIDHARLRKLANPAFSPRTVIALQPHFVSLAEELAAGFAPRGRCEFMAEFSEPYATRVICILLGLDHGAWREIATIVTEMGLALGVTYRQEMERINTATEKLFGYCRGVIAERRTKGPGEDFIWQLLQANEDKDRLSDQELEDMLVLAVFGGIDTTRNQIGLAMSKFLAHPAQWEILRRQPDLARQAVEEVMRLRPTTTWITREALEDFTYRDLLIAKGTTLHLFAESAGTDPAVFPAEFDITVKRPPHYGFGAGIHHCLGHFIARADMTEALRVLSRHIANPRPDGEARWLPDSGNTGPITLPIAFDAGA